MGALGKERIDTASKVMKASSQRIYEAYLDPKAIATWRPPQGMTCEIYTFEPHEGGKFRMSFNYADTSHDVSGKTSLHADVFHGRFRELTPYKRIVEEVEFESTDPAFAGTMTVTTLLEPVQDGTRVSLFCGNVPIGIKPEDHQMGMKSTLDNLAAFTS